MFRIILKIILPVIVLAGAVGGAYAIVKSAPETKPRERIRKVPAVRVVRARPESVRLTVSAYGTVHPRSEISVVPQVSGRVVYVSPALRPGGFFEKDELLLRIEQRDFELALTHAKAQVAQAEAALMREEAEAEIARQEWADFGKGEPNALVLRKPQLKQAAALVASAKARLEAAELDLKRTEILAPFAGRVRTESVDLGQFLMAGAPIALVFSTDYAEVRLSVPDDQIAYLDLPLDFSAERHVGDQVDLGLPVTITSTFAGRSFSWPGRILRTEAELDPKSRVIRARARVEKPFEPPTPGQPPLMIGMYVRADIPGRTVEGATALPRSALRGPELVWVVEGDRLRFRTVTVLRKEVGRILVTEGLAEGDLVCVGDLEPAIDGMPIRAIPEDSEQ